MHSGSVKKDVEKRRLEYTNMRTFNELHRLLLISASLAIIGIFDYSDAARSTDSIQTPSPVIHWAKHHHPRGLKHGRQPCFICPGSSMISADKFDAEYNGVDAQHHSGSVRMPEPVVRPCLHSNKYQKGKMTTMGTQVVRGPKPGTLLDQGTMHRVVVRVAYQLDGDNNNISDSSVSSWHRAYCRYTLQVMPPSEGNRGPVRLCRPPPTPDHGRVACSSVGDDVSITTCRYTCDEGYVTPKSDRHLVHQNWDCYSRPGTSRAPKCIKLEAPVPLDSSQCSGLNLTVPDFDDVHLALPKFQSPTTNDSAVNVVCDIDFVRATANRTDEDFMLIRRFCVAKNNETDAKFNCHYDVRLTLDPSSGRSVMHAELRFQVSGSLGSSWCDDHALVERLTVTAKNALLHGNAEACRKADCSLLTSECQKSAYGNISTSLMDLLTFTWIITASYQPFNYEDYFYEGAEVPEGEMIIEKIKGETEALVQMDFDFRKKIEAAGGRLLEHSFQLVKLDLICPLPGYIVNASTNNCQKCPANTFQSKGICQPCPDGTYQDRGGQTECRPCTDRSLGTPSGHYISRCQRRSGRPVHPSIVAVSKLPNRKSRLSSPITTIQTRQLNGKLGNVAAAYTFADKQVVDTKHSGKKNQFLYSHQQPSSSSKSRRHHPYPYQLATSRMAISRSSAVTNETLDDDPCSPNPCLAGGACFRAVRYAENNRIVNSFKCSCRPGTTGVHCETPHCPPLYCLNGGTCHINKNAEWHLGRDLLNCTCPLGFTGSRCEHRRQASSNDVKIRHHRHHRHRDAPAVHQSDVARRLNQTIAKGAGLMGAHCSSNPCRNGGRCVDNSHAAPAPGFFTCVCPPNFSGDLCDYTPCSATDSRIFCPMSYSSHYPSGRKKQCWIQTSTGQRQCWAPPSSKSYYKTLNAISDNK